MLNERQVHVLAASSASGSSERGQTANGRSMGIGTGGEAHQLVVSHVSSQVASRAPVIVTGVAKPSAIQGHYPAQPGSMSTADSASPPAVGSAQKDDVDGRGGMEGMAVPMHKLSSRREPNPADAGLTNVPVTYRRSVIASDSAVLPDDVKMEIISWARDSLRDLEIEDAGVSMDALERAAEFGSRVFINGVPLADFLHGDVDALNPPKLQDLTPDNPEAQELLR